MYNMYNLELGVFMYKYSTDDLPTIFNGYFSIQSQIHNRETWNMTNNYLRKSRTNFTSKEWKHLNLAFGILFLKKLNCLLMSKHLESTEGQYIFFPIMQICNAFWFLKLGFFLMFLVCVWVVCGVYGGLANGVLMWCSFCFMQGMEGWVM